MGSGAGLGRVRVWGGVAGVGLGEGSGLGGRWVLGLGRVRGGVGERGGVRREAVAGGRTKYFTFLLWALMSYPQRTNANGE